ncbi:MAG: tRNA glutamyl-Q(34) synthetase GluQRS [Pseudomonadota bacterium]
MTAPAFDYLSARLRFAPSPNGYLHLGHAYSALENERWARGLHGTLLLRIEDTDLGRARQHYVEAILSDLLWLGVSFEGHVRKQSDHLTEYEAALRHLWDAGLIYPAPASRSEIGKAVQRLQAEGIDWPHDPDGAPHYPFGERDRQNKPNKFPAHADPRTDVPLRLDMQAALRHLYDQTLLAQSLAEPQGPITQQPLDPGAWGDVLLRGRDRPATYHLAVVVDDAAQQITHVVRGEDMAPATAIHRLLQMLLGLRAPVYHHHRLIKGTDDRKLSKSEGAKSLRTLRKQGVDPASLRARLLSTQP